LELWTARAHITESLSTVKPNMSDKMYKLAAQSGNYLGWSKHPHDWKSPDVS